MTVAGGAGCCAARAVPRAHVDAAGRVRVAAWLDEIADSDPGRALRAILAAHQGAAALIEAIASSSPYLWDLARADPGRLVTLLQSDPETRLAACLAQAARDVRASTSQAQPKPKLKAKPMRCGFSAR